MPIIFENSFIDQIQELTDQLYEAMGLAPYSWTNKKNSIIREQAILEINSVIDAVEDNYMTENKYDCSAKNGTVYLEDSDSVDGAHYATEVGTYHGTQYGKDGDDGFIGDCTQYTCSGYKK